MAKVMILGAGSFGIALALLCHNCGHEVTVWSHRREEAEPAAGRAGAEKAAAGGQAPAGNCVHRHDGSGAGVRPCHSGGALLCGAADQPPARSPSAGGGGGCLRGKGLEQGSYADFSTVIGEEIPNCPNVILSGPSHAEEVSRGEATSIVAASHDMEAAQKVQDWLMSPAFRVYVNDDVIGVELGGALKNIIAVAAGTADGLGLGDNAKAALMTRGITEIARLGVAMGGRQETFAGLSGIGDLIVTCTSMHSRNRRFGILVGQGVRCSRRWNRSAWWSKATPAPKRRGSWRPGWGSICRSPSRPTRCCMRARIRRRPCAT